MIPGGSVGSQWGWGKGQVLYRNRAEFKKKIIFFKKKKHTINQKNLFLFYSFIFFFEGGGDSFCFYLAIQKDKLLKFSEKPITQKSCGFCGRNLR